MIMLLRLEKGLNDNQDQASQVFKLKKGTPSTRSAVLLNAKEKLFSLKIAETTLGFRFMILAARTCFIAKTKSLGSHSVFPTKEKKDTP